MTEQVTVADEPPRELPQARFAVRAPALFVTNVIKVSGLVIAIHEAFTNRDPVVLGLAAFMLAGAQISEELVIAFINSFFGKPGAQGPAGATGHKGARGATGPSGEEK